MRDITLSFINALLADVDIYAKVSTRIYRAVLPIKPTLPAIVVSKIDDIRPNNTWESYSVARIQVTTFAVSDGDADDISGLVVNCLNLVTNTLLSGIIIIGIEDAGTFSDHNPGASIWIYHRDFKVKYL
jgi:hypothetical protein